MPIITELEYQAWYDAWFARGAPWGVRSSGGSYSASGVSLHPIPVSDDISSYTTQLLVGRFSFEHDTMVAHNLLAPAMVDALMAEVTPSWSRMYGHTVTDGTGYVHYADIKELADYIEANYASELWFPTVSEVVCYAHMRDTVGYNITETEVGIHTLEFDTTSLSPYVAIQNVTLKITSDVDISGFNITGYTHKIKQISSTEYLVDVELI